MEHLELVQRVVGKGRAAPQQGADVFLRRLGAVEADAAPQFHRQEVPPGLQLPQFRDGVLRGDDLGHVVTQHQRGPQVRHLREDARLVVLGLVHEDHAAPAVAPVHHPPQGEGVGEGTGGLAVFAAIEGGILGAGDKDGDDPGGPGVVEGLDIEV